MGWKIQSKMWHLLRRACCVQIEELEQTRELGDRTEVEARLDTVRREKDVLEGQVASLQEQLSRSQCEVAKLREQLSTLQEECKVSCVFSMLAIYTGLLRALKT